MKKAKVAAVADPFLESLGLFGLHPASIEEGIEQFKAGLPIEGWEMLVVLLEIGEKELADVVQISTTTLARRKQSGRFSPEESERLFRLGRLVYLAAGIFQNQVGLARWFQKTNRALGGRTPLEYASTPIGAEEVERVLDRILDGSPA